MNITKYLDAIDIIYWINLDRSVKRRINMENNLKQINIKNERIIGTDGMNIPDEELYNNFKFSEKRDRTKIEYACLLSHLRTIKKFAESEYNLALILEDDLSLEYTKYWDKKVSEIIKDAPSDWEIIMLNYVTKKKLKDDYTFNMNGNISCCGSYLINKQGALRLMKNIYVDNKFILTKNTINTADNYIYSNLITYAYKYPYFTYPTDNDSTIHSSHLLIHNYTKQLAFSHWVEKYEFIIDYDILFYSIKYKEIIVQFFILIISILILIQLYKLNKQFRSK